MNLVRQHHSLIGLTYQSAMQLRAQRWAQHLASTGYLKDDGYGWHVCARLGGSKYGTNVGVGPTVADIQRALERSPVHRANLLDGKFTVMGLGLARSKRYVWLVQDFCG